MSRTFKDFYTYKGSISADENHPRWVEFKHHGEYHKVKYKYKGENWFFKPPSWYINQVIVRPERRQNRCKIQNLMKATTFDQVLDAPEFGKGNKPDPNFDWQ